MLATTLSVAFFASRYHMRGADSTTNKLKNPRQKPLRRGWLESEKRVAGKMDFKIEFASFLRSPLCSLKFFPVCPDFLLAVPIVSSVVGLPPCL